MGASTIWSYIELFGNLRLAKAVFVDQAPLQNLAEDWNLGSKGCYDAASLARLQSILKYDFKAVADGNTQSCLSQPLESNMVQHLLSETYKAAPRSLGLLMADHTQADWRPVLPNISIPCLNVVGSKTQCFHVDGVTYVGNHVPNCKVAYIDAGHWLYLEQPQAFSQLIRSFAVGDTRQS